MAATRRSTDELINESTGLYKDNTAGDISASDLRDGVFSWYQPQGICQGRLTLESGVAVSTSDQTAKTNVYFTPYNGNSVGLFDGTSWKLYTFSEITLALGTIADASNYDIFLYDNAGTLTLELSAAWTNDTTRANALALQDGVYVKSGATTRLHVGMLRTTSTTTTEDSAGGSTSQVGGKRFLWNRFNRVRRRLSVIDGTDTWTYSTTSYRQANAASGNQVEIVAGDAIDDIRLFVSTWSLNTIGPTACRIGIGEDSTTAQAAQTFFTGGVFAVNNDYANPEATLIKSPAIGYHYYAWLENGSGSGTNTWYGDNAGTDRFGMTGDWAC